MAMVVCWCCRLAGDEGGRLAHEHDVNVAVLVRFDAIDDARNRVARDEPVELGVRDFVLAQVAARALEKANVEHAGGPVEVDHQSGCGLTRYESLSRGEGAGACVGHDMPFV